MRSLAASRADQMGSRAGSSRPWERPEVPRMIPRIWGRSLRFWIAAVMCEGDAERGRVAKA